MKDLSDQKKIAVLIDADNAQCSKINFIFNELSSHGHIITKRAYADWTNENMKSWKRTVNELSIQPIQQFAYTTGKNSTDSSLIIDAMDLLYTGKYDAFAIVSSDSDFTRLAARLRESEIYVFGFGEKKTPISFRNSCDDFIFTENLDIVSIQINESEKLVQKSNSELIPQSIIDILLNGWNQFKEDDDQEWANVAAVGSLIKRIMPDFDPRTYGATKVPDLISKIDLFEMEKFRGKGVVNIVAYRPKKRK